MNSIQRINTDKENFRDVLAAARKSVADLYGEGKVESLVKIAPELESLFALSDYFDGCDEEHEDEEDAVANFTSKVFLCLRERVKEDTSDWAFQDWFVKGGDCLLATEVAYLLLSSGDYKDLVDKLRKQHAPETVAKAIWDYVADMEDFPRLWKDQDSKDEVVHEVAKAIEAYENSESGQDDPSGCLREPDFGIKD